MDPGRGVARRRSGMAAGTSGITLTWRHLRCAMTGLGSGTAKAWTMVCTEHCQAMTGSLEKAELLIKIRWNLMAHD